MKLYFSPGACSLSPHIVAREAGLDVQLEKVDGKAKRTASGKDFWQINPKGYVPALELDDGQLLTEGPVIVQYLADQRPDAGLVPASGTLGRYRVQELLGYVNSEIHKSFGPLFHDATSPEVRAEKKAYLHKRYALLDRALAEKDWLFGDRFSVADAYLFVVTNWAGHVKLDLSEHRNLQSFQARVAARPAVQEAMRAEGLMA